MALWSDYMKQTQRLLNDSSQQLWDPYDLTVYVNKARREVAMRSSCIRLFPSISGSVATATVTAGGTGYTAPVATVSAPDFPSGMLPVPNGAQATAQATQIGGIIQAVNITYGGAGYFQPIITITDPHGAGAAVTAQTSLLNVLQEGQEVYPFSGVDLTPFPGVQEIFAVRGVSIIYSNYRYSIPVYSMSIYKAYIASFPFQYQYVPVMGAQYGRGSVGSLYLYPIASQTYQQEWDCTCLPSDVTSDGDVDALPDPYTDAVPWLAAMYGFYEKQNGNSARAMKAEFDEWVRRYGGYTLPGRVTNPYGRW